MKTVVVTGGAGFVGSNLCRRLVANGDWVICIDNLCTGALENLVGLMGGERFRFIHYDVCESLVSVVPEHVDRIYNLACPASPIYYQRSANSVLTTLTCVMGICNVLELGVRDGARVLQASTSEVYGDPTEHPQRETYWGNVSTTGPRACYDEGKRCAESLIFDYHRHLAADVRVVRIFNTYGPYMQPDDGRVISNFICQALRGEDITIYGDGSQTRSFQYIDDLLEGMTRMMENDSGFIGPVNIGNPGEFTIRQLADLMLQKIPNTGSKIVYCPPAPDDPHLRRPDITLAGERLAGWRPTVCLSEGLDSSIEYFRLKLMTKTL